MPEVSDAVLVAIITVIGGGTFGVVNHWFNRKTEEAKAVVNKNTQEVEAISKALGGMEVMLENYRTEVDRLHKDLIEERALNAALVKQLEKGREGESDEE